MTNIINATKRTPCIAEHPLAGIFLEFSLEFSLESGYARGTRTGSGRAERVAGPVDRTSARPGTSPGRGRPGSGHRIGVARSPSVAPTPLRDVTELAVLLQLKDFYKDSSPATQRIAGNKRLNPGAMHAQSSLDPLRTRCVGPNTRSACDLQNYYV